MPTYLLGTDNGCTVAKAALFTLDGREVAVASRKVPALTPQPGWHEVPMAAAWQATVESIREVLVRAAVRPADYPTAVAQMVRLAGVQAPNLNRKSLYDAKYARYQQIIAALDRAW